MRRQKKVNQWSRWGSKLPYTIKLEINHQPATLWTIKLFPFQLAFLKQIKQNYSEQQNSPNEYSGAPVPRSRANLLDAENFHFYNVKVLKLINNKKYYKLCIRQNRLFGVLDQNYVQK